MSKKILIVEGDSASVIAIEKNLKALEYQISEIIEREEDIIASIEKNKPDLILMSISLKGMDAANELLLTHSIPVVYLVDDRSGKTLEKTKKTSSFEYISKPFIFKDLKLTIEMALYKHEMEINLLKTKELLNESQRLGKIGTWELNLINEKLNWTDEVYKILEVDKDSVEITYENFMKYIHPEDTSNFDVAYEKSLSTKSQYEIEHRIITNTGNLKYVISQGYTTFKNNGEPLISHGSIQDITVEVLNRKKIEQSKDNFNSLFLNSIDEIYLIDIESKTIVDINDSVLNELGYNRSELIGKEVLKIIPKDQQDLFQFITDDFKKPSYKPSSSKATHRRKDGSIYPVAIKHKKIKYNNKYLLLTQARNILDREIFEEKRANEKKVREVLNELLTITLKDKTLSEFLDQALKVVVSLPFFKDLYKAGIFTVENNGPLKLISHINFNDALIKPCRAVKGHSLCKLTYKDRQVRCIKCGEDIYGSSDNDKNNQGNYSFPILLKDEVLGVLCVDLHHNYDKNDEEQDVLKTVTNTLGIILSRKNDQIKLKNSEKRFRDLFEKSKNATIIIENELVIDCNQAIIDLFGFDSKSEFINERLSKFSPKFQEKGKSSYAVAQEMMQYALKNGSSQFEWVHKKKNEDLFFAEVLLTSIAYKGERRIIHGIIRDISQKKIAEEKLKDSENRYRSLFEQNLSGIYRMSANKKVIECNTAFVDLIGEGYRDNVINKYTKDIFDINVDVYKEISNSKGDLKLQECFVVLKSTGKKLRFLENLHAIKNKTGEIIYYEGSIIDTTPLLEIEIEKEIFEILPAENPNPVIRMDYNLKLLYFNKPSELLVDFISIDGHVTNDKIVKFVQKIINKGTKNGRTEVKHEDTTYLLYAYNSRTHNYINIYAADITELKKSGAAYLQLSSDLEILIEERTKELHTTVLELNKEIDDRHLAEKEVKKSLAEKDVLLNEITHRVKNNLQVIASLLSLQKESIKNEETLEMLSGTGHRIKSMALIHETLYKSNDFSFINIRSYIDSLMSYISNSFDKGSINIYVEVEEIDLSIDTATSCGMIIMELITNSMKYAFNPGDKGQIKLKMITIDKSNYKLTISDNGKGYPDSVDFEETKTLGMQLVVGITSQLQGKITRLPSEGTCFEIIFKDTKRHKYE